MLKLAFALMFAACSAEPASCSADEGPVSCKASTRIGSDINVIGTLPRVNRYFTTVSDNLGDYDFFVCAGKCSS